MWNLVKIAEAVSDKKTFKDFMILYLYSLGVLGGGGGGGGVMGMAKFWS